MNDIEKRAKEYSEKEYIVDATLLCDGVEQMSIAENAFADGVKMGMNIMNGRENPNWWDAHNIRPNHLQICYCYDKFEGGGRVYVYDDISKYWCTQSTTDHDPNGDNHVCDYADYRVTHWMPNYADGMPTPIKLKK